MIDNRLSLDYVLAVVDRTMATLKCPILISGTCDCVTLHGKGDFAV